METTKWLCHTCTTTTMTTTMTMTMAMIMAMIMIMIMVMDGDESEDDRDYDNDDGDGDAAAADDDDGDDAIMAKPYSCLYVTSVPCVAAGPCKGEDIFVPGFGPLPGARRQFPASVARDSEPFSALSGRSAARWTPRCGLPCGSWPRPLD